MSRRRGLRGGDRPPEGVDVGYPLTQDVFEAIRTEAGRLTGSGMNGQPWHFIIVRDPETLRKLGSMASSGPYVAQGPLAIVVATEKSRFAVSDASRAI
jgi:nitroreductase